MVLFLVFLGVSVESLDHMDQVQIKMPLSWLRPTTAMFHTDQSPALLCVFILRVRVVLHVLLHLEKTHTHTILLSGFSRVPPISPQPMFISAALTPP